MRNKIFNELSSRFKGYLGCDGFAYLCDAVQVILDNNMDVPTMSIYIDVGKLHNKTYKSVERSIRYLIERVYGKGVYTNRHFMFEVAYAVTQLEEGETL